MTARRLVAAALIVGISAAAAVVGVAPAASAATASPTVVVAPDDGGIVRSGHDLGLTVVVTNTSTTTLPAGRLTASVEAAPAASASALLTQIDTEPEQLQGLLLTKTTGSVPAIDAGDSATVRLSITSSDLRDILTSASGARALYVQYGSGQASSAARVIADSAIVKMASGSASSVGLGVIIPITAPAGTTGVVDEEQQQQLAGPKGAWRRALRAAEAAPSAAIALDPEVVASIRLAGDGAPPEAKDLLDRLSGLPNEFIRLPYADTDLTLARAAGASGSLDPTSFAGVTVASGSTGATPAPTVTAGPSSSTAAGLTDWNWSDERIAWPVPHTTSLADLDSFATTSRDRVLLSSDDVVGASTGQQAGPLARIGGTQVLVSDATTSSLLSAASADGVDGASALATLTGLLATTAVTGETPGVLVTAGRSSDTARLDQVLSLLGGQSWIRPESLAGLGDASTAPVVRLRPRTIAATEVATARPLLLGERQVQALGAAIPTGAAGVTAPQHLALLAALSSAWRGDARWSGAAASVKEGFDAVMREVYIPRSGTSNAIGTDGNLAVVVRNDLDVPVRVVVRPTVSNGRLQFTGSSGASLTVPANAGATARLAFRSITNGSTDVTLTLETPAGVHIGPAVVRAVTVSAGFDTIVAVVLLAALGLLLALGVYRNVTRRRRPRTTAAA